MPGKLYLATYTLITHRYPDGHTEEPGQMRLVWADNEEQAREKLVKAVTYDDPYATSRRPDYIGIEEAIV